VAQVNGVAEWHINADEPAALDYNDYNQHDLYSPDQYRSSDHDPVIIGLSLFTPVEIPQCNGVTATIYVNEEGLIVGGPHDGKKYRGILRGTSQDDVMVGTDGREVILGFSGDDFICGLNGKDRLIGARGNDSLFGGNGRDLVVCGFGL
jgi:Ca2+-binding RTX toxin-like protein